MLRAINTVHRIRPRGTLRASPVVKFGHVRLGPKKSKNFSLAFISNHADEFVTKMRTGEIKLIEPGTGDVLKPDDLLTRLLSSEASVKPKPVEKKKASKPEAAKKKSTSKKSSSKKKSTSKKSSSKK